MDDFEIGVLAGHDSVQPSNSKELRIKWKRSFLPNKLISSHIVLMVPLTSLSDDSSIYL